MKRTFFKIVIFGFLIYFISWVFVYKAGVNDLVIQSEDTVPALFIPVQILRHGNIYLDDYYQTIVQKYPQPDDKEQTKGLLPFYVVKNNSHYLSAFPIVTPILALPVFLFPVLGNLNFTWELLALLGHVSAALIVSFSAGFFYILLGRFEIEEKLKLLLTTVYMFGTVNYAMLSQALWQHGTLELFLILSLLFFMDYLKSEKIKDLYLTNLFLGVAFITRPTAALVLLLLNIFLLFTGEHNVTKYTKKVLTMLLGISLPILFFFWYNNVFYASIENQGYSSQLTNSWLGNFPVSFFGVWLSPSKGILIYSPVLIFSLVGLFIALKQKNSQSRPFILFGLIVLLHTLIISFWKHWYGGWSFGYRMSSDIIPFLVLLMIPFVRSNLFQKYAKYFYILLTISIIIQISGLIFYDGIWHAAYDLGFDDTSWLWSIKNSEFVFNIRRVMVKLGLLSKACATCLPIN